MAFTGSGSVSRELAYERPKTEHLRVLIAADPTADGKAVNGGLDPSHATEIAAFTRRRIPERSTIS